MSADVGEGSEDLELVARYVRPGTGEEVEVVRPVGDGFPIDVHVRWKTPGPGRQALDAVLASVMVLELDHVADAVADGRDHRLEPLRELATRDGWTMRKTAGGYELERDGAGSADLVSGVDLLLALELTVRVALEPFEDEDQDDLPEWVVRSREVYPKLSKALDGEQRFEPVG